ncbi:MAG: glycosyltransferase family 1 protein [Patescibacteria group bacterium]
MIRALIDIRSLSKGRTSGVEAYTIGLLAPLLRRAPEDVAFTLFYNALRPAPLPPPLTSSPNVAIVVRHIPNKLLDLSSRFLHVSTSSAFADADIAFTPLLNLLRTRPSVARVMTFHDLSFVHYPEFFPAQKRWWHWLQDCRREARRAAAVIVDSEFTKADLVGTFGVSSDRVRVIYPGVSATGEAERAAPDLAPFARTHGVDGPFILSVGVVEPRKNLPALVQAFSLLKSEARNRDLKLVVVGELGWLYEETLRAFDVSPYRDDIVRWGRAEADDLRKLYALARVFAYPSFFEGFGFPPLEAQASGVPVVASNRSSVPEVVGNAALLVNPWNPSELAAAIDAFLENEQLRKKYIENGYVNVKRFSWERAADELLSLFRSVAPC